MVETIWEKLHALSEEHMGPDLGRGNRLLLNAKETSRISPEVLKVLEEHGIINPTREERQVLDDFFTSGRFKQKTYDIKALEGAERHLTTIDAFLGLHGELARKREDRVAANHSTALRQLSTHPLGHLRERIPRRK
jgi:hypothetical protein